MLYCFAWASEHFCSLVLVYLEVVTSLQDSASIPTRLQGCCPTGCTTCGCMWLHVLTFACYLLGPNLECRLADCVNIRERSVNVPDIWPHKSVDQEQAIFRRLLAEVWTSWYIVSG